MVWILLFLLMMIVFSTYVRGAATRARAELAGRKRFRVTIQIAGSGMATRAEMRERFALETEITRQRIGAITDSGSGNGTMWIEIAAAGEDAEGQIREALETVGLSARATVEAKG